MEEAEVFVAINNESAWGNGGEYFYFLDEEDAIEKAKGGDGRVSRVHAVEIEGQFYFRPKKIELTV